MTDNNPQRIMGYPNAVSKVWLVEDEGNQFASRHLSTPDEQPAVVQHADLHAQACQLDTHGNKMK